MIEYITNSNTLSMIIDFMFLNNYLKSDNFTEFIKKIKSKFFFIDNKIFKFIKINLHKVKNSNIYDITDSENLKIIKIAGAVYSKMFLIVRSFEPSYLSIVKYLSIMCFPSIYSSAQYIYKTPNKNLHLDIIKFLPPTMRKSYTGYCYYENLKLIKFLYSKGVSVKNYHRYPIKEACVNGNMAIVKFLMFQQVAIQENYLIGFGLITNLQIIKFLMTLNVDMTVSKNGFIEEAFLKGRLKAIKLLISICGNSCTSKVLQTDVQNFIKTTKFKIAYQIGAKCVKVSQWNMNKIVVDFLKIYHLKHYSVEYNYYFD